jgi:methylmalonyl-CoA mutase C-terminal domain/subunit
MQRKIRVLVGKPGLDGHDRGAKVVAAALRDAGMEVIYTGLHQTPAQIVEAAAQEDVDVVALSILSGAHMTLFPEVLKLMRARGIGDRLLTGGGIIPPEDMGTLAGLGVGRLFGPGASTQEIAAYIRSWFDDAQAGRSAPSAKARPTAKAKAMGKPKAKAEPKAKAKPKPKPRPKAKAQRKAKATVRAGSKPASKRARRGRG